MKEQLYAIFEVKNSRATQVSAALPKRLAEPFLNRLQNADNSDKYDTKLEMRKVGA